MTKHQTSLTVPSCLVMPTGPTDKLVEFAQSVLLAAFNAAVHEGLHTYTTLTISVPVTIKIGLTPPGGGGPQPKQAIVCAENGQINHFWCIGCPPFEYCW